MNHFTIQKDKKIDNYHNNSSYNLVENSKKNLRPIDSLTSGRFEDWKNLLKNFDSEQIYGYGAMGDRYLIKQTASNGALYALASSGVIGLILFLFFTLFALIISIKIF